MSLPPLDEDPPCSVHADQLAGWRCDAPACNKHLCGKCAAKFVNQFYCGICGATASQLVVERSTRAYSTWVMKAIAYPFRAGILGVVIIAVLLAGISFLGKTLEIGAAKIDFIRGVLVLGYGVAVADAAARGNVPEKGAVLRLVRGLAGTAALWFPAGLYLWVLGVPAKGFGADRIVWVWAGLVVFYLPIAFATAVTDASYGDAANPFKLAELAWQLGRRYLATFVAVLVFSALAIGVDSASAVKLHAMVTAPVATDIVAALPVLAVITMVAYLIGLLPYVHGDRFGWGDASIYADPLHPKLVAEAKRKTVAAADQDAATAAAAAAALAERNDARKIHDALKDDNLQRALKIYETRQVWSETSFDEGKLLLLGKGATRNKRNDVAMKILEAAYARKGRMASQALVAIAQLHAQMGHAEKALETYKQVCADYPNTDASKIAALKLNP